MSSDRPLVGTRGPAPRRDGERRRRNKLENGATGAEQIGQTELLGLPFEVDLSPEPPDVAEFGEAEWHPLIKRMWDEMHHDPARKWMTSGDWMALALFCESISRELSEQVVGVTKDGEVIREKVPVKGATLSSYLKLLEHLGVTEGSRLRMRKEITLFPTEAPQIAAVTDIGAAREADVQ
jgi:hypothetical protein